MSNSIDYQKTKHSKNYLIAIQTYLNMNWPRKNTWLTRTLLSFDKTTWGYLSETRLIGIVSGHIGETINGKVSWRLSCEIIKRYLCGLLGYDLLEVSYGEEG